MGCSGSTNNKPNTKKPGMFEESNCYIGTPGAKPGAGAPAKPGVSVKPYF